MEESRRTADAFSLGADLIFGCVAGHKNAIAEQGLGVMLGSESMKELRNNESGSFGPTV